MEQLTLRRTSSMMYAAARIHAAAHNMQHKHNSCSKSTIHAAKVQITQQNYKSRSKNTNHANNAAKLLADPDMYNPY